MRKMVFLGFLLLISLGVAAYSMFNSPTLTYDGKGLSFEYPNDLKALEQAQSKNKKVENITKLGKQTPLTTIEVIKEKDAVIAASASKKSLIDIQESIVRKRLELSPELFKDSSLRRIKMDNREAILTIYTYNDKPNKRSIYASEIRVPVDRDVFYITTLSTNQTENTSALERVKNSLKFK